MAQRINIVGVGPVDFPDTMSDAEIAAAIDAEYGPPTTGGDVLKSAGAGLAKGLIGGAAAANPAAMAAEGLRSSGVGIAKSLGAEVPAWLERPLPSSPEGMQQGIETVTGEFHKPQTTAGGYAHSIAEMVPGAVVGRGNIMRKLLQYGVAPGTGAEYLGSKAKGTAYEPGARLVGALAGIGTGAGASALYSAAKNRIAAGRTGTELSDIVGAPVGAGATRRVADSMEADRTTPQSAAATVAELGDDAMLLDTGRQMRGRAEAIASQPGRGQNTVVEAVENRTGRFGEGTAQRVQQTLDNELGQTQNAVELIERTNTAVDRVAGPLYRQVMEAHPSLWDNRLASLTERPAIAEAMRNARGLAANYGETIDVTARPSLRAWDYVKKDLDRRINAYYKSGGASELGSADRADLGGLQQARRDLVTSLDELTNLAYREARQASATKFELREAFDFGRTAFNSKILPEEFMAELAEMSVPQRHMAQEGFRRELDRIVQATRNEGATARRILDTNSVLQKAEALYGPQAVQAIERRIGAENTFQDATTAITGNSRTAVRQQLMKDTETPSAGAVNSLSIPGIMAAGARKIANSVRTGYTDRTRNQLADVLTAQGDEIDPVVRALMGFNTTRAQNNLPVGSPQAALISALLATSQPKPKERQQ